jgi:hypothetical protein
VLYVSAEHGQRRLVTCLMCVRVEVVWIVVLGGSAADEGTVCICAERRGLWVGEIQRWCGAGPCVSSIDGARHALSRVRSRVCEGDKGLFTAGQSLQRGVSD